MQIMGCRYITLQRLLDAIGKIQIPLVGFDGVKFVPTLTFDDVGLYLFIPQIVQYFKVNLDQAINMFFYTQIGIALALGLLGFVLLFRSFASAFISLFSFFLFLYTLQVYLVDVYIQYFVSLMSIMPLCLYFIIKNRNSLYFYYFLFFGGMAISFSHYVRSYSSLPVIGFLLCIILLNCHYNSRKKLGLLTCLILGIIVSSTYFKINMQKYENYARTHFTEFECLHIRHPFWHTIYLGFGFLKLSNNDNITWDDSFGEKKAQEIDAAALQIKTAEYEEILKNKVFKLIKNQRGFVLWTIFAKIGILLLYFLIFANVGLIAFFYVLRRFDIDIAFVVSFCLASVSPILSVPYYHYALSYVTCAFIFGLFYSQQFLEKLHLKAYYKSYLKFKLLRIGEKYADYGM